MPLVVPAVLAPLGDPGVVHLHLRQDHVPHQVARRHLLQGQRCLPQDGLAVGPDHLPRVDQRGDRLGRLELEGDLVDVVEGQRGVGVQRGRERVPLRVGVGVVDLDEPAVQHQPGDQLVVRLHGDRVTHFPAVQGHPGDGQVLVQLADRGPDGPVGLAQVPEDRLLALDHVELALLSRHRRAPPVLDDLPKRLLARPAPLAQVPEDVRGRAAVVGDPGADVDHGRVPDRLGHAGQDAGAAGQLRQRADHLRRRVGEDPAQRVQLVRLDGVHEAGEQPLEHRPVHVRRALGGQDQPEPVVPPDPGDLAQHLGGDHLVVVRRDQVELVDRQHRERDLLLPGQVLQVARHRGGDDAQVAQQQAPAVDVDERAWLERARPVEPLADVGKPVEGLDPLLRRAQRVRRLHLQDRRLHLDLRDQLIDAERRPAPLRDLAAQGIKGVADQGLDVGPAVHAGHRLQQVLAGQRPQREREPVAGADIHPAQLPGGLDHLAIDVDVDLRHPPAVEFLAQHPAGVALPAADAADDQHVPLHRAVVDGDRDRAVAVQVTRCAGPGPDRAGSPSRR